MRSSPALLVFAVLLACAPVHAAPVMPLESPSQIGAVESLARDLAQRTNRPVEDVRDDMFKSLREASLRVCSDTDLLRVLDGRYIRPATEARILQFLRDSRAFKLRIGFAAIPLPPVLSRASGQFERLAKNVTITMLLDGIKTEISLPNELWSDPGKLASAKAAIRETVAELMDKSVIQKIRVEHVGGDATKALDDYVVRLEMGPLGSQAFDVTIKTEADPAGKTNVYTKVWLEKRV